MSEFEVEQNEKALVDLRNEWKCVLEAIRAARKRKHSYVVQTWEKSLDAMLCEQREIALRGGWSRGPSDLLSIIDRSRWETYHSAVLAWLVDPLAPHGLGTTFLVDFLLAADPDNMAEESPPYVFGVECEVSRGECRADIVVYASEFTLVAENKIDAAESERQCDRIYEAFSDVADARFVFLTPTGSVPRTASGAAANEFRTLSYRSVRGALVAALHASGDQTRAAGRDSAVSYLNSLEREFP